MSPWKDPSTIALLIAALGIGGVVQSGFGWLKDRKKDASGVNKTDVETKLAYMNTVIERLDEDNRRILAREQRYIAELAQSEERSSKLRTRVRELEDELDGVRRSARETEQKCEKLAIRIKELAQDTQDSQS